MTKRKLNRLKAEFEAGTLSRRRFLQYSAALGVAVSAPIVLNDRDQNFEKRFLDVVTLVDRKCRTAKTGSVAGPIYLVGHVLDARDSSGHYGSDVSRPRRQPA